MKDVALSNAIQLDSSLQWRGHIKIDSCNIELSCTVDVKLINFDYKYLMRIIPNNRYLFKCKLVPSVLYDFCLMQEETNVHLFWQCWYIQDLWS